MIQYRNRYMYKDKVIYVDMDDTLCDFTRAYQSDLQTNPSILFPQSQYGFFTKLEPLPGAIKAVKELAELNDVWILTRPSILNPLCYTEKRVWVEKHLGLEWCHKLIICPEKSLLLGDILIDDILWPGFKGTQIMFNNNWNQIMGW